MHTSSPSPKRSHAKAADTSAAPPAPAATAAGSATAAKASGALFWAERAWLGTGWQRGVCLEVDAFGRFCQITPGQLSPPAQATVLPGPVLPGLVNAHSHAFQRAFAGLAERRVSDADDFWSWRDRMYGVALRISPAHLRAVAAQLYVELLQGGYTQVCEFHYLHHAPSGAPYPDPATMAWAVADGAADAGLGLTLLPVLYERAGFAHAGLRDDQRRFATDAHFVADLQRRVAHAGRAHVQAGVAIHSLRAARAESVHALMRAVDSQDLPVHIHVAEQMQEVHDCQQHTGMRPIEWLCAHAAMDARWQLVHATHALPAEIEAVGQCKAGVVICPSTEGNLGDGITDIAAWLGAGVPMAIGSDSHVCRNAMEELRWLEYVQRLHQQRRNVAALPAMGQGATAARLFGAALAAGSTAAGHTRWGLCVGARADMVVLNVQAPGLLGIPDTHLLDATMFACDHAAVGEVYVAGQRVVQQGRHVRQDAIAAQFVEAMGELWS